MSSKLLHLAAFATRYQPSKALSTFVPCFLPASNSFFRLMMCNAFDRLQDQAVTYPKPHLRKTRSCCQADRQAHITLGRVPYFDAVSARCPNTCTSISELLSLKVLLNLPPDVNSSISPSAPSCLAAASSELDAALNQAYVLPAFLPTAFGIGRPSPHAPKRTFMPPSTARFKRVKSICQTRMFVPKSS